MSETKTQTNRNEADTMKIATKVTYHRFLEDIQIQVYTDDTMTTFGGDSDTCCSWGSKDWVINQVIAEGFALACMPKEIRRPELEQA